MKGSPARVEGVVAPVEVGRWRGRRVRKGSARATHAPHAFGSEGDRPHLRFAGGPLVGRSASLAGVLGTTANRLSSRIAAPAARLAGAGQVEGRAWEGRRTPLRPAAPCSRGVVNRRTLAAIPSTRETAHGGGVNR